MNCETYSVKLILLVYKTIGKMMKIQSIVLVIFVLQLILTANSVRVFNIENFGATPGQDISKVIVIV